MDLTIILYLIGKWNEFDVTGICWCTACKNQAKCYCICGLESDFRQLYAGFYSPVTLLAIRH